MKHFTLFAFLIVAILSNAFSQNTPATAAAYHFRHVTNVPLQDMSGATLLLGPTRADEQATAVTNITFPFEFVGKTFTAFQSFSSGALVLHPSASVVSTNGFQIILPWADAIGTGDNGYIKYKVVGTSNRKLVVEYYMGKYIGNTAFQMLADKTFQVWFFEGSNEIQFVYGSGTVANQGAQAIVGIAGNDNTGDLLQVNTATHEVSADPYYVSTTWPGEGHSYVFSATEAVVVNPAVAISSSLSTTICKGSMVSITSTVEGAATDFQWYKDGQKLAGANAGTYNATETGNYFLQVSFANSTIESNAINVFVTDLNANVTATNVTCNAVNNGSISISNATGGNGVYEYSIGNNWQQDAVFSGLSAGTYTVQVRADGCIKSLGNITIIGAGTSPVVTINTTQTNTCGNLILTANPADATSYVWSNGGTGNSIILDNKSAEGTYTVSVSNGNGCTGFASYIFNKQNQLNSYALVALKGILLGENNLVNGAIGNYGTALPVYISNNSTVNGFIRSAKVNVEQQVNTGAIVYAAPTVVLPVSYANTAVTSGLQNANLADGYTGTLNGNYNQVTLGKLAKVTLTGNVFGKVIVSEGAEVTFTASDVSLERLVLENGKVTNTRADYSTASFSAGTIIRIKNKVQVGERTRVNAAGATFYFNNVDRNDERFTVDGENTIVSCNVVLLQGIINVTAKEANSSCTMNGRFIAEYIGSGKNVTWNLPVCNNIAGRKGTAVNTFAAVNTVKASMYPNPGTGSFNLVFKLSQQSSAQLIVVNENGTIVKQQMLMNVQPGQTLPLNLVNQPAGVYLVKIISTEGVQTMKAVIAK
jgi:hypothetical protein